MKPEPLRLGVIGLGRIGQIHFSNLRGAIGNAQVVAAADPFSEARDLAANDGITTHATVEALLETPQLDGVVVCSPTDEHANHVAMAAQAGKHVFCEKPLDLSVERVQETLTTVQAAGVQLMLGFNRRFDPHFAKVQSVVRNGGIGDPHMIRITSRDPSPPPIDYIERSGGLFLDMTIHDFDMARYLAASPVTEIYARGSNLVDPAIGEAGDIDSAVCVLSFANGATAVIDNSRKASYGYDQRVEVFGALGMIAAGNERETQHQWLTATGEQRALPKHFFLERYEAAYRLEMQAFVDAIRNEEPVPVTGADGLQALLLGLAAQESMQTNRPVTL